MHSTPAILNPTIILCIALSIGLHGLLFMGKNNHQPDQTAHLSLNKGTTSVELTLMPSVASFAKPPAETAPTTKELLPEPTPAPNPIKPTQKKEKHIPLEAQKNSIDQEGSTDAHQGIESEAKATSDCTPIYPRISQRRGEQGSVTLSATISKTGKASDLKIIHSSGHKRLDNEAIKTFLNTPFTPASKEGTPIVSTLTKTFKFELN